ncbi:Protein ABHD11 like protein [Argiope bruennichi]|uniref:sn-1-specific diacylglycerol lipase ABHD11 n=1 Tax=Argiope bruennichi TaxID=94029 RepID=A0A8T0FIE5_ARGBR|nr:Protein ABHD11 like protein [Argiope bruennichi]
MATLLTLVCIFAFVQVSISDSPVLASKPKPVDIVYTCLKVVNEKESKDDIPLILLHGLTGSKEMFRGINEVLAWETGKRVCSLDMRNHGESPWNDELDIAAMTEDVKHFLDKIKAPKAVVLGVSMGGKIAVHLALNYPTMVDKIISVDMRPNSLSPESIKEILFYIELQKDLEKILPQGVTEMEAKQTLLKVLNDRLAKINSTIVLNDPETIPIKCSEGKCSVKTNPKVIQVVLNNIMDMWTESSGHFDGQALFIYGIESSFKIGEDEKHQKIISERKACWGERSCSSSAHFPRIHD